GGDEFAVLRIGGDQPADADALARRIVEVISTSYDIEGQHITVGTSIGVALATGRESAEQLLRNADIALYRMKAEGRAGHRFFEPRMNEELTARRQLEEDLREALQRQEFRVFYQPLINL